MPSTPQSHYGPPKGFSVSLQTKDPALAENGQVQMPIQETLWAARFGMCVGRFGISWLVNCEKVA